MNRIVQPEILDSLPPGDPLAIGSRRDLQRINWWMRHPALLARALQKNLPSAPAQITELGAGDGAFLLQTAQRLAPRWQGVKAVLLDRQNAIPAGLPAQFSALGWSSESVVADAFEWNPGAKSDAALTPSPRPNGERAGVRGDEFGKQSASSPQPSPPLGEAREKTRVVIANLFLHHFQEAELKRLLGNIAAHCELFIALEPLRLAMPGAVRPWLRLIGCNEVTLHDAVVSIRAGFCGKEISAHWPAASGWRLTEHRAGCFSQMFVARKISAA